MNFYECSGCFFAILGAMLACITGLHSFGPVGAVVGGIVGLVGGWLVGPLIVAVYFAVAIFIERRRCRIALWPQFGRYYARSKSADWKTVRRENPLGHEVYGVVVRRFYYGFVVEIGGCRYPSFVKWADFNGSASNPPSIGSQVTARINRADDREHQFELTQLEPDQEADRMAGFGPKAIPCLLAMLRSEDWRQMTAAIRALTQLGPDAATAVSMLAGLLEHQSPDIRSSAASALAKIQPS
jgi:hypothetical protein